MKKLNVLCIIFISIGMMISGVVRAQWTLQTNPLGSGDNARVGKIQFVSANEGWIDTGHTGCLLHTTDGGTNWNVVSPFPADTVGNMSDPATTMSWVNPTHGWTLKTFITAAGNISTNANGAVLYSTDNGGSTWAKRTFPLSNTTVSYSPADLQGKWQLRELVAAKYNNSLILNGDSSNYSSWAGWGHGLLTLDATGNGTFSGMTKSDGNTDSPSSVSMSISPFGVITVGGSFDGFMSTDKSVVYITMNDGGGGNAIAVMQKVVPGVTYSLADLQGTWQIHSLVTANPNSSNKYAAWMHGTITMDASGNGTANFVKPNGSKSQNLLLSISSDGFVTMNGTDFQGFVSADKKSISITMTDGGSDGYDFMVMQKVVAGTGYTTSNLQGKWQTHILTTTNPSLLLNQQSTWSHGVIILNANGEGTSYFTHSNDNTNNNTNNTGNNNNDNNNISMSISSDGLVTASGNDFHGFMSPDKNSVVITMTEDNGEYTFAVMQKDLSVSGDVGLQVQFVDNNNGWVSDYNMIYGNFQLYKTTDGGTTWNPVTSNAGGIYQFVDANNGWMIGSSVNNIGQGNLNNIYHTTDGGFTWNLQMTNTIKANALYFSDLLHGWVVGSNGLVLKTTDGGTNWTAVTNTGLSSGSKSKCVFFLDANTGWIGIGNDSIDGIGTRFILATKDGGTTWTTQSTPVTNDIFSLAFTDANNGWFTSDYGQIAHYTPPKTVNISAGGLTNALSTSEKSSLRVLAVTGTIDARDFKTLRDGMPLLATIDLTGTTILDYTGTEGTYSTDITDYPANTIPRNAFYLSSGKNSLTSVILPATITAIGRSAFNKCYGLTSINIPSKVTSIGYAAFNLCTSLSSVNIPSSVTLIDTWAFGSCTALKNVSIPSSVTTIGDAAFAYSGLNNIVLPNGVTSIGQWAFQNCSALNAVTIPSTVSSVGYCAFTYNNALTSFQVASDNPKFSSLDGVLFDKTQKKLLCYPGGKGSYYQIPDGVTVVDTAAFEGLYVIQNIIIPSSVTTLAPEAFYFCNNLKSVDIPSTVTSIGRYAFYSCSGLTSINVHTAIPVDLSASDSVFNYVNTNACVLYVPAGAKTAYQNADKWKDFVNIVEEGSYLTYNVSVPVGTKACYIAGEMNSWTPQQMAKVDSTHYTINIVGASTSQQYKYCSGPAWDYVELNSDGYEVANRNYAANDVVAKWTSVYNPGLTYYVTVPAGTKACYIAGEMNGWSLQVMTKVDDMHYMITIPGSTFSQTYKYSSGPGWNFVELNTDGSQVSNRSYSVNDVVAKWTVIYDPSPVYITYNVIVPDGTKACYLAGEMNSWSLIPMTKVDATHYSITILSSTSYAYKFCSGPSWDFVEVNADGTYDSNRTYSTGDVVERWLTVFDPALLTGADYYLPLSVGNFTQLHTSDIPAGSEWGSRNTYYSIIRSESINNEQYFVEQGKDILDNNPSLTTVFRIFWLRKDDNGNIVAGAYSTTGNDNLDSATVFTTPAMIFPNQFLTVNYSQTFQTGNNMLQTDSVISVTATVGSFTNCIQVRSVNKTNGTASMIEDNYYAYHVGIVEQQRLLPVTECHTDFMVNYLATSATGINELTGMDNIVTLYPNPVTGGFYINASGKSAVVAIYNLSGVALLSRLIDSKNYMDVSMLPPGLYVAKITTSEGTVAKKLIKK